MTLARELILFFEADQYDHCESALWGDMEEEVLPGVFTSLKDSYGGEGQGESLWAVWHFKRGAEECYLKFDGWYASFVGGEFESVFEVEPKTVEVTKYE